MSRPLAIAALLAWSAAAAAQSPDAALRGQSEQTYKRLVEASRQLAEGKSAEAADAFQRILDEAGDDLVSENGAEFRPARRVAQAFLARMPADVLRGYRVRADAPARQLLDVGKKVRDPRPLRELLDRYFASRPAEEALLLLGELAFERGEFRTAEGYWRRLLPAADGAEPSFPDPKADPAAVRARVILAVLFQGETERARQELAAFEKDHPKAAGRLAGKDGPYSATLQALLDRPPVFVAEASGDGEWTALGGSASRNGRATARLPRYWPGQPTWTAPISREPGARTSLLGISDRAVAFHPVVLDGVAYVADAVRVFGFDVRTGRQRFAFDLRRQQIDNPPQDLPAEVPVKHNEDFTLTAAGGRLFARLGSPAIAAARANDLPPASYLVGFAPPPRPTADGPPLRMEWTLPPPVAAGAVALWEGAPVWADGRLYAAFARFDGGQLIHAVACYNDPPGRPVWVTDVCEAKAGQQEARYRHEPLTLAGGNVVFCSHSGAVVAVDARTGKPSWALRYPKASRATAHRDLNPPIADGGRVFVAPTDGDEVFALDAVTGRVLWRKGPIRVDQFLGVTRGRVVCAIADPNRGIRGLSVVNGSDREPDGWAIHHDHLLSSRGRGLVSDEFVLWPTKGGLFLLDPDTGMPARPPLGWDPTEAETFGNLAYADGVLLVATPTALRGYVAERARLAERKAEAAVRPGDANAARRLALALADVGQWDEAEAAVRAAGPAIDPARARAEWLADRAERAIAAGCPDEARTLLRLALGTDYPTDWRARAAGRLLTLEPPGGGEAAVGEFLAGLGQPADFADAWVLGPDGVPARLRDLAARHFGAAVPTPLPAARPPPKPADEFDLGQLHRLGAATQVVRETVFPSVRCVPLLPFDGAAGLPGLGPEAGNDPLLFVTDGARVLAYRPADAEPAWESALPDGTTVTHAAVSGDAVLAAGPRGAVRLRRSDGGRLWAFRYPDADPLPGGAPRPVVWTAGGPVAAAAMSDFALAGSRLVARVGDHHLLALDTASGSVAWVRSAAGPRQARITPYPHPAAPRFARPYLADEQGVLVHLSTGQRWALDPAAGRVVHAAPSAMLPWDGPPARLGAGRAAVADGPALVNGIEADRTRVAWTLDAGGEASQTGRPPRVLAVPDGLIVAVSRNHGVELDRLLGAGGTRLWHDHGPAFLPAGELDLSAADTDLVNLYVPAGGRLTALRMTDGRTMWVADLPASVTGWRAYAGRRAVVVLPEQPVMADVPSLSRAAISFALAPRAWRVPSLVAALYDGWTARTVPVLVLDPEAGRVRRRLDLPAVGPALGVHLGPDCAVVATAGKAYWLK
jgi:outer membrane protein assembly factor BamB